METRAARIEQVAIEKLTPNPKNRNIHPPEQIERLKKIIEFQGFRIPLIVSNQSGHVVSGNGRLQAAKELGIQTVPVIFQDFDSTDQEYAAGVSDNAIAAWSDLDLAAINIDIPELGPFDIDMLGIDGFTVEALDRLNGDPDEAPEVPKEAKVHLGDLWQLGGHRLLCGDCTKDENIERLLRGEKPNMVYSDPPYGFGYNPDMKAHPMRDGSTRNKNNHRPLQNDDGDWNFDISHVFRQFGNCEEIFLWGADYYHLHLPKIGGWIVWDKTGGHPTMDKSYLASFELCWSKQTHKRHMIPITWMGCFGHTPEDGERKVHPTQKPIKLGQFFFEKWSKPDDLIFDHYLGSGSTLIACEKTNRKCYGTEIDPLYVQVIIERWQKFAGKEAVREDGKKWNELSAEDKVG